MLRDLWDPELLGLDKEMHYLSLEHPGQICILFDTLEGVNQRVTELATTVDQEDEIIYSQLDDARHDRALLRARVNMLYRDRPFHRRTALLMEEEARVSRTAWAQSMDACDQGFTRQALARSEAHCRALEARVTVLETEVHRHEWQRQATDDLAVQHIMRTQALEAGARVDTLEDTGSSS
ncbi:hypothetical protein Tco_0706265 [Tanacetum coccineum]|uniref:Uncharacterized protein n=1 Tax=Tanacetum coccineum TaxID=301880 RepID=A0ABQ4Y6V9_9ASTR